MLRRFRPRLSFANVIAMIALFAALGGGYAMAFVGSGQLQKGKTTGLAADYETVRSLDGIGSIQARCVDGAPTDVSVRFRNTSGEGMDARGFTRESNNTIGPTVVSNNTNLAIDDGHAGSDYIHLYVYSNNDDDKRPQASIEIGTTEPGLGCAASAASVLVLNTEEQP